MTFLSPAKRPPFFSSRKSKALFLLSFLLPFLVVLFFHNKKLKTAASGSFLPTIVFPFLPVPSQQTTTSSPAQTWTLISTGDIMLGRFVNVQTQAKNNFLWPWEKTAAVLKSADLTLINLENPLVQHCPPSSTGMLFCAPPEHLEGLKFAGVDLVSLANNHSENWGQEGIENTTSLLQGANIKVLGLVNPQFATVKGQIIAFLAYNDLNQRGQVIQSSTDQNLKEQIPKAKEKSDLVIIFFHWGEEYTHQPTPRQKHLARLAIDLGADIILGNHPHWTQEPEYYQEKLIIYSHGNFIFDQNWSQKTSEGFISRLSFQENKLIKTEILPIIIKDNAQPQFY